jgi:NAD(P)H-hydrate epimerase
MVTSVLLATAAEMREIDRVAIEEMGIAGIDLMERAGAEVARAVVEELAPIAGKRIAVVAGRGNNGGDGLVAARRLREAGAAPFVALACARGDLRGDAATALARADEAGVPVRTLGGPGDDVGAVRAGVGVSPLAADLAAILADADVAIDALLGTGASGAPHGAPAEAIAALAAFRGPVVAIDVPSGVDATTGAAPGAAVRAALTVTLALAKPGHFLYPGRAHVGRLRVAPIGIPDAAVARVAPRTRLVDAAALRLPPRAPDAHKGRAGRVLVAGASPGLTGSVVLAGMAALRAGAGVVTLAVPRGVQPVVASMATELMTAPLPETKGHVLGTPAAAALLKIAERYDVIALGPGLSRAAEVRGFVDAVLEGWSRPLVIDADGLWMLARGGAGAGGLARLARAARVAATDGDGGPTAVGGVANAGTAAAADSAGVDARRDLVVTPHVGEAERMSGEPAGAIESDRVAFALRSADAISGSFLLKGNPTVVADCGGRATLNTTGNRGMATAGSGDVLTGVIAALIAQGMAGADAARAGAWLHGRAGDLAAAAVGWRSLVASDIAAHLPAAVREADAHAGQGDPS